MPLGQRPFTQDARASYCWRGLSLGFIERRALLAEMQESVPGFGEMSQGGILSSPSCVSAHMGLVVLRVALKARLLQGRVKPASRFFPCRTKMIRIMNKKEPVKGKKSGQFFHCPLRDS
ncbi:MAG: hypothetical protein JW928_08005, partial [Candidatus Aureabacteria bacterium]|nr:hypothetical protein [Candidatus Auribacterota bacterium]